MIQLTDQFVVEFTLVVTACLFCWAKFNQVFRIVRRDHFDYVEQKVLIADGLIAELQHQIHLQQSGKITQTSTSNGTKQLAFNLPNSNARSFKFYYELVDPETGERFGRWFRGKHSDWEAWKSGKKYIWRRGRELWVDESEIGPRDMIAVLRKHWDRRANKTYYEEAWIYSDQRRAGDMDTGPFEIQEVEVSV